MEELNLSMFKPYDIRTKREKLDKEHLERLCLAVAHYYRYVVKAEGVVLGRDARLSAPEVAESLLSAFREYGLEVCFNPLPVSTCQFYYSCMCHRSYGGVMVTASHNPGSYIGLKLLAPELFPIAYGCGPEGGIERIKELYLENDFHPKGESGRVKIINYLDSFISYSMRLAGVEEGSLKGLKVLLEFFNGSAGPEVTMAFQRAGAEVEALSIVPDGSFPKGDPNPIIESSIAPTREMMKSGRWDIGFSFDGDGDRMDLMYKDGSQIVPGLNMALLVEDIMKLYGGEKKEFYADVKAIPVSLLEIARRGANVHIIRNGHSFIKAKLRENCSKGYFGSEEESAHYYLNFPYDINDHSKGYAAVENTLFFALLTAKTYLRDPSAYDRMHSLVEGLHRRREWPLHCEAAPEKMPLLMEEVEERMRQLGAVVIKNMDDSSDLDATLMRFNLPSSFTSSTTLEGKKWAQVAQRISRSEDAMCRWEVVSNDRDECERLNNEVRRITEKYVEAGWARY